MRRPRETTFTRLDLGGEAVWAADGAVMAWVLMSAKFHRAVAIFSRTKKKAQSKFLLSFFSFFFFSFFPSSFWRRVPRLAPIAIGQSSLNKCWTNEWTWKRKILYFSPKTDRRLGGDCKTTGETQCYTKISHWPVILDSKKFFRPKWLERVKQVESSVF